MDCTTGCRGILQVRDLSVHGQENGALIRCGPLELSSDVKVQNREVCDLACHVFFGRILSSSRRVVEMCVGDVIPG